MEKGVSKITAFFLFSVCVYVQKKVQCCRTMVNLMGVVMPNTAYSVCLSIVFKEPVGASMPGTMSACRSLGPKAAGHHLLMLAIGFHKRCMNFIFTTPEARVVCFLVTECIDVYIKMPLFICEGPCCIVQVGIKQGSSCLGFLNARVTGMISLMTNNCGTCLES